MRHTWCFPYLAVKATHEARLSETCRTPCQLKRLLRPKLGICGTKESGTLSYELEGSLELWPFEGSLIYPPAASKLIGFFYKMTNRILLWQDLCMPEQLKSTPQHPQLGKGRSSSDWGTTDVNDTHTFKWQPEKDKQIHDDPCSMMQKRNQNIQNIFENTPLKLVNLGSGSKYSAQLKCTKHNKSNKTFKSLWYCWVGPHSRRRPQRPPIVSAEVGWPIESYHIQRSHKRIICDSVSYF